MKRSLLTSDLKPINREEINWNDYISYLLLLID